MQQVISKRNHRWNEFDEEETVSQRAFSHQIVDIFKNVVKKEIK